jgi:hypothetical protein
MYFDPAETSPRSVTEGAIPRDMDNAGAESIAEQKAVAKTRAMNLELPPNTPCIKLIWGKKF